MTRFTDKQVDVNIAEIKQADMDAIWLQKTLLANWNAASVSVVAMKQAVGRTMRLGAKRY